MAMITAEQVRALREETGLPMMECKTALTEASGDNEAAKTLLQKKYKGKLESRSSSETGEGRMAIYFTDDRKTGAIADVRCETAPVAKTDQFIALAATVAKSVAAQSAIAPSPDEAAAMKSAAKPGRTIKDEIMDVFGILRENMKVARCRKMTGGYVCGYVHHDGKSGVLITLDARPNPESTATDLCHHVIFSNPLAISRDQIPASKLDEVRSLARELAQGEGKPAQLIDKIAEGKVNAFCGLNALMEQEHVKVPKTAVKDVLKGAGVTTINEFVVFKIGS
ncbi:MAG: translation elongation factor Ts [Phycisphaerales bacterium]|nr:translation elongation factor Ts [Phycisphaerales bacterium]